MNERPDVSCFSARTLSLGAKISFISSGLLAGIIFVIWGNIFSGARWAMFLFLSWGISFGTVYALFLIPLNLLMSATRRISNGDFSKRLVWNRLDGFGEFATLLDKMSESINQNRLIFEKHARSLEEKSENRSLEIEKIQGQLIQAGKLAAVGELAAGIAHELNNPIGGILGYSQFLSEKMRESAEKGDVTSAAYLKYMELMARESQRCKKIIQNLLKFSRSSNMEFSIVNVNVVLADTVEIVQNQMRLERIQFKTQYHSQLPMIQGDSTQLQQVFMNILINAFKAISSAQNGEISVSTEVMIAPSKSSAVEIKISDNGVGIPEQNLGKIFDPFYTTRPTGEGTGLGLSLSYGIIKAHHGEILVESKENKGTVFRIILPSCESF